MNGNPNFRASISPTVELPQLDTPITTTRGGAPRPAETPAGVASRADEAS